MLARWMSPAAIAGLVLLAPAEAGGGVFGSIAYGPLVEHVQFSVPGGTIQPNGTINATPACRVARRLLCTVGDGSCGSGGVRRICSANEKRVQIGSTVYCDRWVCS